MAQKIEVPEDVPEMHTLMATCLVVGQEHADRLGERVGVALDLECMSLMFFRERDFDELPEDIKLFKIYAPINEALTSLPQSGTRVGRKDQP